LDAANESTIKELVHRIGAPKVRTTGAIALARLLGQTLPTSVCGREL